MSALNCLELLRSSVPEVEGSGWKALNRFADDLDDLTRTAPDPREFTLWSTWVMGVRRTLAEHGHRTPSGSGAGSWQVLAQFIAGFHDLDLRDCLGAGHGALILDNAAPETAARWRARLEAGQLVGIAATERHGGSRVLEITTRARVGLRGNWLLSGEKSWVARLTEASGFVVFFRDPNGHISAAVVEAGAPGLDHDVIDAAGLTGCSWGLLRFQEVAIDPVADLVGGTGDGVRVFRNHFAGFRPLVTATALGAALRVHTLTADILGSRKKLGIVPTVRDNALMTLGRSYVEIISALLGTIVACRLATARNPQAELISQLSKADGVDTALRVVTELTPLIGAAGFQRSHPVAKVRADISGLLYADGIHDALYRSGGRRLLEQLHLEAGSGAQARSPFSK